MSFPRAKIQRFNETPSCSPAPGTYAPQMDTKVKTPLLRRDTRLTSEGDVINGTSKLPVLIQPTFRTPQLSRKTIKNVGKCRGQQRSESISSNDDAFTGPDTDCSSYLSELDKMKQRLKATVDELNKSKDLCEVLNESIVEKTKQIEEMQQRNEALAAEMEFIQNQLEVAQSEHKLSLTKLEVMDRNTLTNIQEIHCMIDELMEKRHLSYKEMLNLREELDNLASCKLDMEQKVSQKQQMILLLQSELSNAEVELVECRSEYERLNAAASERNENIETLKATIGHLEHQVEETDKQMRHMRDNLMNGSVVRENLEEQLCEKEANYEFLQENYNKLLLERECLKEEHSKKIEEIVGTYDNRLGDMVNSLEVASEFVTNKTSNFQEICNEKLLLLEYKVASAISQTQKVFQKEKLLNQDLKKVENEARIITEKLLRAEEELRKVMDIRDELKLSDVENKITIVELQDKIDLLTVERDSVDAQLVAVTEECNMLRSTNKKLTVGNRNLNDSLEALRVRLLESESDIEEMTKLKYAFESDKKELELTLQEKMLQLEEQKENIVRMEADNLQQIEKVREHLLEKLDLFKQKAVARSMNYEKFEAEKCVEIQTLSSQLESFHQAFEELNKFVAAVEEESENQVQKLEQFQKQQTQLEESYASLNSRFEIQTMELQKYKNDLTLAHRRIDSQDEQILEYKCQIEKLTADIDNSETKILEMNEALNVMEESNAEHKKEIEALTEKLDHQRDCAQLATQQIANLEATRSYQEHQIQSLSSELERHKEYSHQATDHVLTLVNSNTVRELQIEALTEELEEVKVNTNKVNGKIEQLKIELLLEQDRLKESTEEIKLLEGDRFVKEEQLKELTAEVQLQKDISQKYSMQVTALEKQKVELEARLSEFKLNVEALQDKNTTMEQTFNHAFTNLEQSVLAQKEKVLKELADAKKVNKDLLNVKSELELEVHEMNRKYNSLEQSINCYREVEKESVNKISQLEETLSQSETERINLHTTCQHKHAQIEILRAEITNLNLRLSQQLSEGQNEIDELKRELDHCKENLTNVQEESLEWQRQCKKMNSLIGPFKEQLESYQSECKVLETEKGEAEESLRELAQQYAATLGHQNHKQKIRHVQKIMDQNCELKEENRSLRRTIEKMRKSNAVSGSSSVTRTNLSTKGKENISRNNGPLQKSPAASPNSKPFADRTAHKNVI